MKPSRDVYHQLLRRVAVHDAFALFLITVWLAVFFDSCDWRVLLGLAVFRACVWVGHARWLLDPVRMDHSPQVATEAELRAAHEALRSFMSRFQTAYLATWLAMAILALAHGALFGGDNIEAGRAEYIFSATTIFAVFVAILFITRPPTAAVLASSHHAVIRAMTSRGMSFEREPGSLASYSRTITGVMFALAIALTTGAGMARVQGLRTTSLAQQRGLVELAAVHVQHGSIERIDTKVQIVPTDELPPPLRQLATTESPTATLSAIESRHARVLAAAPVGDGRWALAVASPDEKLGSFMLFLLAVGVIVIVRGQGMVRMLTEVQAGPIAETSAAMQRIIQSGDILAYEHIIFVRDDEIGQLATNFNDILDILVELASAASAVAKGDLRVELDRPGDLYDAFRGMLTQLRGVVTQIRHTALELTATATELHGETTRQLQAAEHHSEHMQAISSRISSLAGAATDISNTAVEVLGNAEQSATTTDEMTNKITNLSRQAADIGELLQQIREVADRSDLLALNGSLEATRAGEAGRGFALVASEMRRLAEQINATVNHVRMKLEEIEDSSKSTMAATTDSRQLARNTAEAARTISSVTRRQSDDTEQVSDAVRETAAGVAAGTVGLTQIHAEAQGLRRQADGLEALTRHFEIDGL